MYPSVQFRAHEHFFLTLLSLQAITSNYCTYCCILTGGQVSFSGRLQILEDGSLLIARVRASDRGRYTCARTNEAGTLEGEAWLTVLVRTQIVQPPADTKEWMEQFHMHSKREENARNIRRFHYYVKNTIFNL